MYKQPSRSGSSGQIINKMKDLSNALTVVVDSASEGQRVDNFLLRVCKGVPRSHVYRILRSGEVRVNSRRVDATYRLQPADRVRIPPLRLRLRVGKIAPPLDLPVIYEDDALLVVNKPAGIAVHGGSGISFGVIEQMRAARPQLRFLELVHRLDRETSGLLILAKKRSALTALHAALREGRETQTVFRKKREMRNYTLLSAELLTGRTHQIRVHLNHLGFPIAGDDKYGDFDLNRALAKQGLKRMFLHAGELEFGHPLSGKALKLHAPLPEDLSRFLDSLGS